MKFLIVLFVVVFFLVTMPASQGCTTFQLPNSQEKIVAKNLNWYMSFGRVVVNPRNLLKTAGLGLNPDPNDVPLGWLSKYGSLTFNKVSREFPYGGMNEKGLVAEVMVAKRVPDPNYGLRTVNELQWIQYILDTSADVNEAIMQARKVKIVTIRGKVHYMVCDPTPRCAVFEYKSGTLEVFTGRDLPFPALANSYYKDSLKKLSMYDGFGGRAELPKPNDQSKDEFRFVKAVLATKRQDSKQSIRYAFDTLDSIGVIGGGQAYSEWSLVYDPMNLRAYFRTKDERAVKSVSLNKFNLDCNEIRPVIDMKQSTYGDVSGLFFPDSDSENERLIASNLYLDPNLIAYLKGFVPTVSRCLTRNH